MASNLPMPVELTDAELDAVAAGLPAQAAGIVQAGLINAGVIVQAADVLDVTLQNVDILSNNNVAVAVGVLGVGVAGA